MIYNLLTRRHFETAVNAGELSGPGVRRGSAGNRALGTWVQFDVRIEERAARDGPGRLLAARFLALGCPHVIAVADWIAEQAVALTAAPELPESVAALRERFELPAEKTGRLLVIEDAWIAALSPPS